MGTENAADELFLRTMSLARVRLHLVQYYIRLMICGHSPERCKLRLMPLGEHIICHEVRISLHVAGPFAHVADRVPPLSALARSVKLRGRDTGAAVVMGMNTKNDAVTVLGDGPSTQSDLRKR